MNLAHFLGLAENEEIVVAAHLAVPRIEARAAIAFLVEPERLDHGAHGAVEHQDACLREPPQLDFDRRLAAHHAASRFTSGRNPSRWQMANTRSARLDRKSVG